MKIAVSTAGDFFEAEVELRFGRATSFLIYDTESDDFTIIDNKQQLNAAQGAGIQSAQNIINAGAEALISGHCGPKAMRVLNAKKIAVYVTEKDTIKEAILKMQSGNLKQITEADVEEHWV